MASIKLVDFSQDLCECMLLNHTFPKYVKLTSIEANCIDDCLRRFYELIKSDYQKPHIPLMRLKMTYLVTKVIEVDAKKQLSKCLEAS